MTMRSLLDPPPKNSFARFPKGETRFILTLDTEEEFDWDKPLQREGYGVRHVYQLAQFQKFCENEGVVPIYLVDWPIVQSEVATQILRDAATAGKAEIGIQLHPWVNPPFDEEVNQHNSFAGNLPRELEAEKLSRLRNKIEESCGVAPLIYRAGRYGLGPNSAQLLRENGVAIDSSVRPKFNYNATGGPDYREHPLRPYWLDDAHTLLELPLTTCFWGVLRQLGDYIYPRLWRAPQLRGVLSRTKLLERIPLTPEGVSLEEAIRGVDIALDEKLPVLVFSFHSPSLSPGYTPYVQSQEDLDELYDWWRKMFAYLRAREVVPSCVAEIMRTVER